VKTKNRGEVIGSTRKLYRQKGTGRARAGTRRTPVRVGGGHSLGKLPVDHGYRLPRKAVQLATRMALLSKFKDDQVVVLDKLAVGEPKTKVVAGILKALGLERASCLLAVEEHDSNVWRSARNIENLSVAPAGDLNAYELLRRRRLVVTRGALDRLRKSAEGEAN
jgi:large subunit ribosomal protein L4